MRIIKTKYLFERLICLALMIIIIIYGLYFFRSEEIGINRNWLNEVIELSDGWYITGQENNHINMPESMKFSKDKPLRISRIIDSTLLKGNNRLCINTYYCDVNVYINNMKVYSYESNKKGIGKTDGKTMLFAKLKSLSSDKTQELTIEYIPQFELNKYNLIPPVLGEERSIIIYYHQKGIFSSFIANMFVFIGVLLMFIHILILSKIVDEKEVFSVGVFSFVCGIYLTSQIDVSYLLIINQKILYECEFLSLSLIGVPLLFIMYRFEKSKLKIIYVVAIFVNVMNFCGQLFLYCLGLRELRTMLTYTHVILFVSGIIAIITVVKARNEGVLKKSVIALVLGGMSETILYYLNNIQVGFCIKAGILVFVIMQITYQFKHYRKMYDEFQENEFYKNLAYRDILTGISNRNAYENDILFIEENKDGYKSIQCAVIDLNGLKYTNDTYGHLAGDELIRTFGHILRKCLGNQHKYYRTGGDEFVILFINISKDKMRKKLSEINESICEYNFNSKIRISYALGMAEYNDSNHENIMNMIMEADEKMYINKVESKACRA